MSESQPKSLIQAAPVIKSVGILGLAWALFPAILGFTLIAKIGPVSDWLTAQGDMGVVIYIAAFAITSGFGLLPTYAQAILGGWVFGITVGIPAALAGFVGGALIGYIIARCVTRNSVAELIENDTKWKAIRDGLLGGSALKTLGIITLVRVPPHSPFALTNLVLSAVRAPIWAYLLGTALGMLPRTAVFLILAASFQESVAASGGTIGAFIKQSKSWPVLVGGLVLLFIVFAIISAVAKKALANVLDVPDDALESEHTVTDSLDS